MTDVRDPRWYRLLLGWLEASLRRTTVDRMGLRATPLKLLRFADSPGPHHTTFTTYEHSDRRWTGDGVQVGYELVFAAAGEVDGITVLRRVVETLAALERPPAYGTVIVDLFQGIDGMGPHLRHAVFTTPWAWDALAPLREGDVVVEPVMVVAATEAEVDLVRTSGFDALARQWEVHTAPLLDPGRPSVV